MLENISFIMVLFYTVKLAGTRFYLFICFFKNSNHVKMFWKKSAKYASVLITHKGYFSKTFRLSIISYSYANYNRMC